MPLKPKSPYLRVVWFLLYIRGVWVCFLTLLTPFHLLDLVHSALEDVALVRLDTETGNVAHVGWQKLRQLLDVAAFQLPPPFLQAAEVKETEWMCRQPRGFKHLGVIHNLKKVFIFSINPFIYEQFLLINGQIKKKKSNICPGDVTLIILFIQQYNTPTGIQVMQDCLSPIWHIIKALCW